MHILVINRIAGHLDRLEELIARVHDEQIEAVFVLGNVVSIPDQSQPAAPLAMSGQTYSAALTQLATLGVPLYLIPGEYDPPFAVIEHLVETHRGRATIHLVHRTVAACGPTDVVAGFGGQLTQRDKPTAAGIHFPAWEARVALAHLQAYDRLFRSTHRRILLFAVPPRGTTIDQQMGVGRGVELLNSLIRAYQPLLQCCGGPADGRGSERINGTVVVNPGWLADGSYALVDTQRLWVRLGHLSEPSAMADHVGASGSDDARRAMPRT